MTVTVILTRGGLLDEASRNEFDSLLARLRNGPSPLLVHLHGGLVDEAAGLATAERLSGTGETSYDVPPDWEQLYVIWRTGLLETIGATWRDLHKRDRLYRALLGKLLEFFLRLDASGMGRGGAGDCDDLDRTEIERRLSTEADAPFGEFDRPDASLRASALSPGDLSGQLRAALMRDPQMISSAQDISAAATPPRGRSPISGDATSGREILGRLDRERAHELRADAEGVGEGRGASLGVLAAVVGHGVAAGRRVHERMRDGRDHGVHATVVEEILRELYGDHVGRAVWSTMREHAADHFIPGGAGSELLDALAANPDRRVVVVGHSAGSILISHMLIDLAARGAGHDLDVVLLAPAVRSRLFADAAAKASGRIARMRIFMLNDERERADAILGPNTGYLYPSSLLYLVSGLFETDGDGPSVDAPILGMQRFRAWGGGALGPEEDAASQALERLASTFENALVYSPSTGRGTTSNAQTHGGIDDDPETLESVGTFLQ